MVSGFSLDDCPNEFLNQLEFLTCPNTQNWLAFSGRDVELKIVCGTFVFATEITNGRTITKMDTSLSIRNGEDHCKISKQAEKLKARKTKGDMEKIR